MLERLVSAPSVLNALFAFQLHGSPTQAAIALLVPIFRRFRPALQYKG
ncbi:hypothetical protein J2D73_11855 [Acetobacter sacchari]|uniref:Uncharacterized protein n=1 Tax=Acetobacter sacchari TaxID=2661687 RepID=A0ABS3LX67_9PROT|nr:hypothetical protein [Acetobacter sacchari]MBO1360483.1 hypothetical protein [Acetobacter sacchari]